MQASMVFIFQQAPFSSPMAREGLEALLAAAAFEQNPTVIFMGDGIWQLLESGDTPSHKNHSKMLGALPLYGVEHIYVHQPSLSQRHLEISDLLLPAAPINNQQFATHIASAKTVFNF